MILYRQPRITKRPKLYTVTYFDVNANRIYSKKYTTLPWLRYGIKFTLKYVRPLIDYYIAEGPNGFKHFVQIGRL